MDKSTSFFILHLKCLKPTAPSSEVPQAVEPRRRWTDKNVAPFNLPKAANVRAMNNFQCSRMCAEGVTQQRRCVRGNVPWDICGLCSAEFVEIHLHPIQNCDCK